jgi:hypothetical protein
MQTWQEFYNSIRNPDWPECDSEDQFDNLPESIKDFCINNIGYKPGSFRKAPRLSSKIFPIKSDTACQLKWTWSTVYLTTEDTASCHRTNHHKFNTDTFNFHNTPEKIQDREQMLNGLWPTRGCNYCQDIEKSGGQSDRITNLNFPGIHYPPELDTEPTATEVTPRILEVYLDNTCNLKCVYCGPYFSSLWDAENKKHGRFQKGNLIISDDFQKSKNIESNKQKLLAWIKEHGHNLTVFNILGGEPLYQKDLEDCLEVFENHPAPNLKLQIFTNLNVSLEHLTKIVQRIKRLIDTDCLREFEITASLDCWGLEQEYARYPLNLKRWEENFNYVLEQPWINLIINSTITPLTVKTLPDLLTKINSWRRTRPMYHYQNSVNHPSYMFIDIFGDIFIEDFEKAIALKPESTPEEIASKKYLQGIATQSAHKGPNIQEIIKLHDFLNEMDRRRNTNWRTTFPWLIDEFNKYIE